MKRFLHFNAKSRGISGESELGKIELKTVLLKMKNIQKCNKIGIKMKEWNF